MTTTFGALTRPNAKTEAGRRSRHRAFGLALAAGGLALASISFVNGVAAGDLARNAGAADQVGSLNAWSFGLTTAAFGTVKLAIALILLGIVRQIWIRVETVKASLPQLVRIRAAEAVPLGDLDTDFGPARVTSSAPEPLLIHRLAGVMWAPMLAMGALSVYAGLLLSFAAAGNVAADPSPAASQHAWVQGLQFLGEGMLLSGISFLLGTILAAIRTGGGEVQESLGLAVATLRMPTTAKVFVALMATGLMIEVVQLIGYAYIATVPGTDTYTTASTWLGPLRELGLGALLSGIVLALAAIARALGFQFARITQIISTGR